MPDDLDTCPVGHPSAGYLNVGRDHYGVCHEHRLTWYIGSNLFTSWRCEPDALHEANARRLSSYTLMACSRRGGPHA